MSKNQKIKEPNHLKVIDKNSKLYQETLEKIEILRHKLAESKLEKLSVILLYKYGFENIIGWIPSDKKYMIYIEEFYWEPYYPEGAERYNFSQSELIENDVEDMAHDLAKLIWSTLPLSRRNRI